MGLIKDANRIQIRITDLFAYFKVVIAIVDEGLGVLTEMQGPQPLHNNIARNRHLDRVTTIYFLLLASLFDAT